MRTRTAPARGDGNAGKTAPAGKRHTLHWTAEERQRVTGSLNLLLANYQVHYQKLRNYHWNVKGSDFFDLHAELEVQYQEAQENIDLIAERVRVFRERPLSTYGEYIDRADIEEDRTMPSSEGMVKNLLRDYVTLLDRACETVDLAVELHDLGTETMVKGFITQVEKHHWMLSAFSE
jgi:starvation-inducible DNA-binding protein